MIHVQKYLEEFLEVVELAVNVPTHGDGGVYPLDVALLH